MVFSFYSLRRQSKPQWYGMLCDVKMTAAAGRIILREFRHFKAQIIIIIFTFMPGSQNVSGAVVMAVALSSV